MLSREGLNVWEADWCGDDAVVAVASEDPGESAWYDSPLVLIDAATGADRVIATSDVQFGLPVGSLDGTRAAVVEAPCSDRQLVSGRAVVVDLATDAREIEIEDADLTWLGWRTNGGLAYTMLRRGDTVFGEIDAGTGERTETWSTTESVGSWAPYAAVVGEDGFAFVRQGSIVPPRWRSSSRVPTARSRRSGTRATITPGVSSGEPSGSPGRRPMVSRSTDSCSPLQARDRIR